jgi:hypothetical protein
MAGSEFLKNLKNAVDTGEFNSDAAKKINEIDKLADIIAPTGGAEANLEKRLKEAGVKTVTEEEALELNSEYEKKMNEIKKVEQENKRIADLINMIDTQLKTLIEIEEMVKASIEDMSSFMDELEVKFEKEFESEDPMYAELSQKIDEITSKYGSIINN